MEVEAIVGNIDSDLSDSVGETLRGLTLSLKQGNIYVKYTMINSKSFRIDFVIKSGDLFPNDSQLDDELVIYYSVILTINSLSQHDYEVIAVTLTSAVLIVAIAVCLFLCPPAAAEEALALLILLLVYYNVIDDEEA